MNSIDRYWAVLEGQPSDKIPVVLGNYNIFLKSYYNISILEYLNDIALHTELLTDMANKFDFDVLYPGCAYIFYGCGPEAGLKWKFSDDSFPVCPDGIIDSAEDLSKIEIPNQPNGYFAKYLDLNRMAKASIGSERFLITCALGPFSVMSFFRGYENFLIDMVQNQELFATQMGKGVEFSSYIASECLKVETSRCELNEIFISTDAVNIHNYHNLILPSIEKVCELTSPPLLHWEAAFYGDSETTDIKEARKMSDYFWGTKQSVNTIRECSKNKVPGFPGIISLTSNQLLNQSWDEIESFLIDAIDIFIKIRKQIPCIYLMSIQAVDHKQSIEVAEKLYRINELAYLYKF
jgi:hypothetical protein